MSSGVVNKMLLYTIIANRFMYRKCGIAEVIQKSIKWLLRWMTCVGILIPVLFKGCLHSAMWSRILHTWTIILMIGDVVGLLARTKETQKKQKKVSSHSSYLPAPVSVALLCYPKQVSRHGGREWFGQTTSKLLMPPHQCKLYSEGMSGQLALCMLG